MAKTRCVRCVIYIDEVDGKLSIMANIPDNAEGSIAATLAKALIEQSSGIMNAVLGENKVVEKMTSN
jgi:hypothetical protein